MEVEVVDGVDASGTSGDGDVAATAARGRFFGGRENFLPDLRRLWFAEGMPIQIDDAARSFFLQTKHSTYAFAIHPILHIPIHLYWGKTLAPGEIGGLVYEEGRSFSPSIVADSPHLTFDTLPQEFPTFGSGDFRNPILEVEQADGSRILDLQYVSHRALAGKPTLPGLPATYVESVDEAETLEIVLHDALSGLTATLCYTVYRERDALTRSVRLQNDGVQNLTVHRAGSASVDFPHADFRLLHLPGAWVRERQMEIEPLHSGTQAFESRRGTSSHMQNPFLALLSPETTEETGEVFAFSFVYSGNFLAQAEVDQFQKTRVTVGINPFQFSWQLEPTATFQTPEVVLVHSATGLGGMSRTFHALYRERLCRGKFRDAPRPILINNWEATYFDFTAEKLLRLTQTAAEVGIELFVLDDGWFGKRNDDTTSLGDWVVNEAKLPAGLGDLAAKVRAQGLQFGLWFEPEMVSPKSDLYRTHPDWCLHVPGRRRSESRNQLVLDLSRPEVCEYLIETVGAILAAFPITYVKWDMNRHLTEVGSASLPPARQRETAYRYVLGFYRVCEELVTRFPDTLFEGCSGGGGRFDPGILHYMPQIWTSDNTDAVARLRIQYGTSLVYPLSASCAHVSAVPNHQVGRLTSLETRGQVACFGMLGYEFDLNNLSAEDLEEIRQQVLLFKDVRGLVQTGNQYRLRNPFTGNEAAWMVVDAAKTEALVFHCRILAQPNGPETRLKLAGLDPAASYRIAGQDTPRAGGSLMYAGLIIPSRPGDFRSQIWRLQAV